MSNVKMRIAVEKAIAERIVDDALAQGYTVSVNDSEVWTLNNSTDKAAIMAAMFTSDADQLSFGMYGTDQGWVYLVYGNDGYDVISDYSSNQRTSAILEGANALAEKIENGDFKIVA